MSVAAAVAAVLLALTVPAQAQLFPDNEARRAIVDLRSQVNAEHERLRAQLAELTRANTTLSEQLQQHLQQYLQQQQQQQQLRRSLIDLSAEIEQLRAELARLRGSDEQLARNLAELQRRQTDVAQATEERLRRFEPQRVSVDGREFLAEPAEQRDYERAMATLRGGDFAAATSALGAFLQRHPGSGYADSARFWLGNAQYGRRDHAAAITTLREFIAAAPQHPRVPEAMLAIANAQIETRDTRGARATLTELQREHPRSEAAGAARERLATLR
jgi:tol-pal system protein YbgF